MKKIRKAIIPAAGLGTRLLPITKEVPKEMLPIINKPAIQYIIEEAILSGIEDIIIVTGKGKNTIEDYFDSSPELEKTLRDRGYFKTLHKVKQASNLANIHYIRQKEPKGLGHAIWCARKFIGDEPFAVLLSDEIIQGKTPCIKQLIDQYNHTYSSIVGVVEVPENETHRYGIIETSLIKSERFYLAKNFLEKPKKGTTHSNLAIMGRYILTPQIFDFLSKQDKGIDGEIQLTDSIQELNNVQQVYALKIEGERFDIGNKLGFVKSTINYALKDPDIKEEVLTFLLGKVNKITFNR
ncbi:UTP--glucose-1-phosphate uridylyltransferase GalU [Cytobacillus firmus]|uniref:UTP--glucose-1-phosphate uridylyltransferase GalU n=1 Tax=Cytobacillus firmus TaxID=1399 RepID=UPI0030011AFD